MIGHRSGKNLAALLYRGRAVSLFFAFQSLRSYSALPFDAELGTALQKLYQHLPGEAKVRIYRMRDHLQLSTLHRGRAGAGPRRPAQSVAHGRRR